MPVEVLMPKLGESVVEGTLSKWLKKVGDTVSEYEPLAEVSSDKVDTEIPAPASGVLLQILVEEGTTVHAGTPIAIIGTPEEAKAGVQPAAPKAEAPAAPEAEAPVAAESTPMKKAEVGKISPVVARLAAEYNVDLSQVKGTGLHGRITKKDVMAYIEARERARAAAQEAAAKAPPVSPVVAKLAAEHGIDLSQVKGTGKGGRVTKKDIQRYIEEREKEKELPPWEQPGTGVLFRPLEESMAQPEAPAPPPGPTAPPKPPAPPAAAGPEEEIMPLSRMRLLIAEHMVRSKHTSPHATTVMEVDMSRVVAHRNRYKEEFAREGIKLTFTPYFIMAAIAGLKAVPEANSVWAEDKLILKKRVHMGMAVALENGLIVPVIRNADSMNLRGLAMAVNDLAERARSKKLSPDEVQGATFSITNHGVTGSLFAAPIINQPNAGILGVGAIVKRVVVLETPEGDQIAIRPMCYLSFTFDHRILDGASADKFLRTVKETLENWT
jgi:pyruvate/2-oxoglutarate dehydrogenase complex dihydrolipoamide acyltransferase (E2) component